MTAVTDGRSPEGAASRATSSSGPSPLTTCAWHSFERPSRWEPALAERGRGGPRSVGRPCSAGSPEERARWVAVVRLREERREVVACVGEALVVAGEEPAGDRGLPHVERHVRQPSPRRPSCRRRAGRRRRRVAVDDEVVGQQRRRVGVVAEVVVGDCDRSVRRRRRRTA